MSERMSAEIWIGGKVPSSRVPKLCAAISAEGVSLDWDDAQFSPASARDLQDALKANAQGVALLWLCDHASRWGEFSDLEMFLQKHNIPYTRRSDGNEAYDPETIEFRPGSRATAYPANLSGEPVVKVSELLPVRESLAAALELARDKPGQADWSLVEAAYRTMCEQLSCPLPPLEPFSIDSICGTEGGENDDEETEKDEEDRTLAGG